jgi:DNA primase
MLRNQIPIDEVITDLLNLKLRNVNAILRFRCPLCHNFHTATNHDTNLARCFDCQKNFNSIDLVMTVGKCSFIDAVELLKDNIDR